MRGHHCLISICTNLQFQEHKAVSPTIEGAKSQLTAKPKTSLRTTHPTGCRGPAAATNNGTISVLLGVAVGSGKQEVVLKQGVVVPCQYRRTETHTSPPTPKPPSVSLCPLL